MKMMPKQGHSESVIRIDHLVLRHGPYLDFKNEQPFLLSVDYWYECAIKSTEDEPGCEDFVEIERTRIVEDAVYFTNNKGDIDIVLYRNADLTDLLTDSQREEVISLLISQAKEDRYYDADANRTAPDERIRRELGWGFNEDYDRDAT